MNQPFVEHSPRSWQHLVQKLAATRPASWLLARLLRPADRWLLARSRGRLTLTTLLTGLPVVVLTTRGARSGQPRSVPLVPLLDGQSVVLVASAFGSQRHPAWYHNLRADPRATLTIDGRSAAYLARRASPEEWDRYWKLAVATYPGFDSYRRRSGERDIPVLVLTPVESAGSLDGGAARLP